jgi:MOSC domain-containing protein YiiM
MQILHVNRSMPRNLSINGKDVSTGIYKEGVTDSVRVHMLGLDGDGQADLTVHGGIHQAVYGYPVEHYAHWEAYLGVAPLPPGTFGENLTTRGLLETDVCIGDVHRLGNLLLQVTSPRIPCFKLGHQLGRADILKPFLHSGRCGYYFKVLEEGSIIAGTTVEVIARDPQRVTVRALLGIYRLGEGDREAIETALKIEALSPLVRQDLEVRLAKS